VTSKVRTAAGRLATLERYELLFKIGTGGAATVYLGRRRGPEGFSRLVAVKRAHPHLQGEPADRRSRLREASLASRLHHANVVAIQDVELSEQDLLLVMDYIEGASLSELLEVSAAAPEPMPLGVVMRIALDACAGLRAVHDLTDEHGRALSAVHRDISPQNILVGTDGLARISDFGLAKLAEAASHTTGTWRTDTMAGKLAYLAPELVQAEDYDARCDLFSLGVVLWEAIASRRLFGQSTDPTTAERIVNDAAPDLSRIDSRVPVELARVIARALSKQPRDRWSSARQLAEALEEVARHDVPAASSADVGVWVERTASEALAARRELICQCTEDVGDRPSVDFAFAGTASMVADGLLPMADDAPTPHRAERALEQAVSQSSVTESSVTAVVPLAPILVEASPDAPEDEPTVSERETLHPAESVARVTAPASRRWRIGGSLAAAGGALLLGLWWLSSSSSVASESAEQDASRSLARAAAARSSDSTGPAPATSHPGLPNDGAPGSSDVEEDELEDEKEDEAPVALAEGGDTEPRGDGESDDPYEGEVTIDLDEPDPNDAVVPSRAVRSEAPKAATPKPPANPYRR